MWIGIFVVFVKKVCVFELYLHPLNCPSNLSNAKTHLFQCIHLKSWLIIEFNSDVTYWGLFLYCNVENVLTAGTTQNHTGNRFDTTGCTCMWYQNR